MTNAAADIVSWSVAGSSREIDKDHYVTPSGVIEFTVDLTGEWVVL